MHWSSKVPFNYKKNEITDELHRANRIASDFHKETRRIRSKYTDAGYPKLLLKTSLRILTDRKNLHCFDCFCCKARAYFAFVSLHFFCNGTISKAYLTHFPPTLHLLNFLKKSKSLWFSQVFRRLRKETLVWNGLPYRPRHQKNAIDALLVSFF